MTGATGERGAATVLVVAIVVVVLAAGTVATAVAEAVAARHQAAVAADASALAAASRVGRGPDAACVTAGRVAVADGARLLACTITGPVATVTVEVALRVLFGWPADVRLNARAGPAETYRDKAAPVAGPS